MQETKGEATMKELGDYIKTNDTHKSVVENKSLHRNVSVGLEIEDSWKGLIPK